MRNSFKILFYIKKRQPLKSGYYSILCRITINGNSCVFSTNLAAKLSKWDNIRKCVSGRSEEAVRTNRMLNEIKFSIHETFIKMQRTSESITPQALRNAFWRVEDESDGLISFFRKHNQDFKQMVGITRSQSTLYKYRYVHNHLQNYITTHYDRSDIPLKEVDITFVRNFHCWLINEVKCAKNTIWLYMVAFKHIMTMAVNLGLINRSPFSGYRLRCEQTHKNFLVKNEIRRLIMVETNTPTECLVRDAFVFSCFTGLSYSDVKALNPTDIVKSGNDMYIAVRRIKTGTSINIPLLHIPVALVKRHYPQSPDLPLFKLPSNFWCNNILNKIMKRAEISKHITFHTARHTFATTMTLAQGVPIEIVSNMLGHTNIKTTQTYAKVLQSMVNSEISRAAKSLNSYFRIQI